MTQGRIDTLLIWRWSCVCFRLLLKSFFPQSGKVDPPALAQVTVTMTAAAFILGCMTGAAAQSPFRKLMDTRYIQEPDLDTCIHI